MSLIVSICSDLADKFDFLAKSLPTGSLAACRERLPAYTPEQTP
jgi:hypothetical protein